MASRYYKQIMTLEELLNKRINNNSNTDTKKKASEYEMTNNLYIDLFDILTSLNYKVKKIAKEFKLINGICDFVCELENNEYLIIECKTKTNKKYENNDLKFSFAVGQLLTYRTILCMQYGIKRDKVKLMLATNTDSLMVLDVINYENLDIDYLVYNKEGVKYYGKNR